MSFLGTYPLLKDRFPYSLCKIWIWIFSRWYIAYCVIWLSKRVTIAYTDCLTMHCDCLQVVKEHTPYGKAIHMGKDASALHPLQLTFRIWSSKNPYYSPVSDGGVLVLAKTLCRRKPRRFLSKSAASTVVPDRTEPIVYLKLRPRLCTSKQERNHDTTEPE